MKRSTFYGGVVATSIGIMFLLLMTLWQTVDAEDWTYPRQPPDNYQIQLAPEVDPSLRWIETEKLRILTGWLTTIPGNRPDERDTNPLLNHTFEDVLDAVIPAGFNVIVPSASAENVSHTVARKNRLDAMIQIRLEGARTMYPYGYMYRDDQYTDAPRYVTSEGESTEAISPFAPQPWEALRDESLSAIAEAEQIGVPELFFGIYFDIEILTQHYRAGYDYSDVAWSAYREDYPDVPADIAVADRHDWLEDEGRLSEYQRWQEQAIAAVIRQQLQPIREVAPHMVFFFYHYRYDTLWYSRAVLAGVSTPQAPAIAWDDAMYFSGYTEMGEGWSFTDDPDHIANARAAAIEYLGHEPLYVPSLNFREIPRYPDYSVDRAGREFYLLVRSAVGAVAYSGARYEDRSMLEDQRPFFAQGEGFHRAHELLATEGSIPASRVTPVEGEFRERLQQGRSELNALVEIFCPLLFVSVPTGEGVS